MIITTEKDQKIFKELLGDGNHWGINCQYAIQQKPQGIAQALLIGEEFLNGSSVALALGDNLFHGKGLVHLLDSANRRKKGGTIFAYPVRDPERYGVVKFDKNGKLCCFFSHFLLKKTQIIDDFFKFMPSYTVQDQISVIFNFMEV